MTSNETLQSRRTAAVPRGVAMGLFVGVFFLIPGVQIIGATLFCLPVRGNVPIAAGMTFLTNPFTTPFLILAAIPIGNLFGFHADTGAIMAMYERQAPIRDWLAWLGMRSRGYGLPSRPQQPGEARVAEALLQHPHARQGGRLQGA